MGSTAGACLFPVPHKIENTAQECPGDCSKSSTSKYVLYPKSVTFEISTNLHYTSSCLECGGVSLTDSKNCYLQTDASHCLVCRLEPQFCQSFMQSENVRSHCDKALAHLASQQRLETFGNEKGNQSQPLLSGPIWPRWRTGNAMRTDMN